MSIVGRNQNIIDNVNMPAAVSLNSSTATKILDANPARCLYRITNNSALDIWIKEQAASVDNLKQGFIVFAGTTYESPPDTMYQGEISAIAVAGSPSITPMEYQ